MKTSLPANRDSASRLATMLSCLILAITSTLCLQPAEATQSLADESTTDAPDSHLQAVRAEAEKGDAKALFELARAYNRGLGVTKNTSLAFQYTRESAEKGYAPAQTALGSFYGRGVEVSKDVALAVNWYRKAADQGYALAQCALAGFYQSGTGVSLDLDEAVQWYKKAALQGDPTAECELGRIYFSGTYSNYPVNYVEAVKWLQRSADHGNYAAMNNLGHAYEYGLGGLKPDTQQALKWYRIAAEHGSAGAQACLGEMYRTGRGVSKDLLQAYVWLSLSYVGGNVDGKHSAPEVGALLRPTELDRAEKMIADFLSKHPLGTPSANEK